MMKLCARLPSDAMCVDLAARYFHMMYGFYAIEFTFQSFASVLRHRRSGSSIEFRAIVVSFLCSSVELKPDVES